jgi:hypothetical protein
VAEVLTGKELDHLVGRINQMLGGDMATVAAVRMSHEALRAERDEARREREEWRERADRAEAALGVAETFCVMGIFSDYCSVCHQPKTSNHKDTCPFRVLAGREPEGK